MAFSLTYGENNNLKRVCTLFLDSLFQRTKRRYDGAFGVVNFSCYNNNNNNNNNKDLTTEIQHMWNVKTKAIPIIIGANGTISMTFRKYVSNTTGNHEVKELQETAIFGHCTHTSESTYVKVQ